MIPMLMGGISTFLLFPQRIDPKMKPFNQQKTTSENLNQPVHFWVTAILLILILVTGAYLRLVGIDWDEEQHLHPDERFLTMVEAAIQPVGEDMDQLGSPPSAANQPWRSSYTNSLPDCEEWGGYFDTACSPLNPNNRGYDFYVYGTLPIFIVRYAAEFLGMTGYGEVYLVGRALSALSDLIATLLVFAIARMLYGRRVALLAAAFSAFSVLLIQQSHFFTVDTFTNLYIMLGLYFVARIVMEDTVKKSQNQVVDQLLDDTQIEKQRDLPSYKDGFKSFRNLWRGLFAHSLFWPSVFFGVALGMAVASKINAAVLAITLPVAILIYLFRQSASEREQQIVPVIILLILSAIISVVTFRVFQPYAFKGPGFFNILPNKAWLDDLSALRAQTSGDVDFPPALQWARRPLWFSFQNLVTWGLGLPLGVLSWAGYLWMGWRIINGNWKRHVLLWAWTGVYFGWQSLQWNSTMRYQLPIYPMLAIIAAWFIIYLWEVAWSERKFRSILNRSVVFLLGTSVLASTLIWAFAFSRIYTRPHTRVEATRWIFQNIPGAGNLTLYSEEGVINQPLALASGLNIQPGLDQQVRFTTKEEGSISALYIPHILDRDAVRDLSIGIVVGSIDEERILLEDTISEEDVLTASGDILSFSFDDPVILQMGKPYSLEFYITNQYDQFTICDPITLNLQSTQGQTRINLPVQMECMDNSDMPYTFIFEVDEDGILQQLSFPVHLEILERTIWDKTLNVELHDPNGNIIGGGAITSDFVPKMDPRGDGYRIPFADTVQVTEGDTYSIAFSLNSNDGNLSFSSTRIANESSWDDGLPLRLDGYDPFGGIYQGGLNFEMYWDDNEEKYQRFVNTLDQADIILITSSRQWGTTTRVPERYPLTTEYYHRLIGCPPERTVEWCYNVAEPGMFQGDLGFELLQTFQSNPSMAGYQINDQFAEEAFTVYDHPKVFIFQKTDRYDPSVVREILGAVDLSKVIHVTPKQADSHPGNLLLPQARLEEQRRGGTWSDFFDFDSFQNRVPLFSVLSWYVCISLLGLVVYPLVRFSLAGLTDHGYPFTRITGLLLLSVLVWLAGSARIPFNRTTISMVLAGILTLNLILFYIQRNDMVQEIKVNWKYYLRVEALFLLFFVIGLLIKIGNPDLWHPWKGGEKPMDFSYFNAVLKSTSFPPFDPWYAGGYINYYYYGFVLVGVFVKYLGILPSIAYNLILATLFSMIAMGAYSVVWNLVSQDGKPSGTNWMDQRGQEIIPINTSEQHEIGTKALPFGGISEKTRLQVSLVGAFMMAVLGNLGVIQMFFRGLQMTVVTAEEIDSSGLIPKIIWTVSGLFKTVSGTSIPIRMDEWYWNPSRVISYEHGNPITEFPFFTFLYGDLHAHLIALPVALLVIAWVVAVVKGKVWQRESNRSIFQIIFGFLIGGIAIGALYPINLSDIYTYLPLGLVAFVYSSWVYFDKNPPKGNHGTQKSLTKRILWMVLGILALIALSQIIYQPYSEWYGQGYSEIQIWRGTHTPILQYLTHWGSMLFLIVSWMIYESIDWMSRTPVSALRRLVPYRHLIWTGMIILVVMLLFLGINLYPQGLPDGALPIGLGVHISWLVIPLAAWVGILILRPGISDEKRMVLFFIGTGLMLTLMVEIVVVSGDIGRMNTVFKFYLHTWTLYAISCGVVLGWLLTGMRKWNVQWRTIFQLLLVILLFASALYPLLGTIAKIMDRMEISAPRTLDGMTYMKYATYHDEGVAMDLSQDYDAIRWMQDNIEGSPVIVEANSVEYHWGTRYTIYTGLPGVVGWNWHQRQQRTINPHEWVFERVDDVHEFYQTEDLQFAEEFLKRYEVQYIVFGQLEKAKYQGPGLLKFDAMEGVLWHEVYEDRDTIIYKVVTELYPGD